MMKFIKVSIAGHQACLRREEGTWGASRIYPTQCHPVKAILPMDFGKSTHKPSWALPEILMGQRHFTGADLGKNLRNEDINATSFAPVRPGKTHTLYSPNSDLLKLAVEGECPGCKSRWGPERFSLPLETSSSPLLLSSITTWESMVSFLPFISAILQCSCDTKYPDSTG